MHNDYKLTDNFKSISQFPEDLGRIVVPLSGAFYVKHSLMLFLFYFRVIYKIFKSKDYYIIMTCSTKQEKQ